MITATSADAIELLTADHRRVEQLFRHLRAAGRVGATENQRDLAQRIVRELSVHAAVEEQVLYPAARELLADGDRVADKGLGAHEVEQALVELERVSPGEEDFAACAERLLVLVGEHVAEEEGELFPALRRTAGQERLQELGTAMERAKKAAPTRPHPHAPNRPPANIVIGAVTAVADHARDAARSLVRDAQS